MASQPWRSCTRCASSSCKQFQTTAGKPCAFGCFKDLQRASTFPGIARNVFLPLSAIQLRHDFLVSSHSSIELNHVCLIQHGHGRLLLVPVSLCIPIGPSMSVTSLCGYVLSIRTVILCFVNHKYPGVGSLSPTTLSCNHKNLLEPHEKGQQEIENMESLAAKCELYVKNLVHVF